MRALVTSALFLTFAAPALAAEPEVDIRPVQESSTDLFNVLSQLVSAKSAYDSYDYGKAFEKYRYVYLHDPGQKDAALGYANSALALGKINLAQDIFNGLQSEEAVTGQILCGVIKGEVEHAEPALRNRLKTQAHDGRLWNILGQELDRQSRFSEARQAYAMAGMTKQRPGLAENNIGQSLLAEGNTDKALEYFTRAINKAPDERRFDNNLRLAYLMKQDYVSALKDLPSDRASHILTDAGVMAYRQDDTKLAHFLFMRAQSLSPVHNQKLASYIAKLENRI